MKAKILYSLFFVGILTSCSSAYKSSQTPDDVYYSPAQENYYVQQETTKDREDNFLRMKSKNNRFQDLDDYYYWNDTRYTFNNCYNSYAYNWGNTWHSYYYNNWNNSFIFNSPCSYNNNWYSWNYNSFGSWNNPYYYMIPYYNPAIVKNYGNTKGSVVTAYSNTKYNNTNTTTKSVKAGTSSTNTSTGFGNLVKKVFSGSGNNGGNNNGNNSSWDRPVRTYGNNGGTTTSGSSNAGGRSGGFGSTGSSSGSSRSGRN